MAQSPASSALEWYRQSICRRQSHTHGPDGELDCLLLTYADLKRGKRPQPDMLQPPVAPITVPKALATVLRERGSSGSTTLKLAGPVVLDWGNGMRLEISPAPSSRDAKRERHD